jgi:hypothetical protein
MPTAPHLRAPGTVLGSIHGVASRAILHPVRVRARPAALRPLLSQRCSAPGQHELLACAHPRPQVMAADGSGSYSDIIAGLQWVKAHVQRNGYRQAVVSMSIGGPRAASLNDAVEDLARVGGAPSCAAAAGAAHTVPRPATSCCRGRPADALCWLRATGSDLAPLAPAPAAAPRRRASSP